MLKVSIVTTCYNRAATVVESVRSVMRQSYDNLEHIVVDGASKDGTVEAIKACGSTRIARLVSEPDRGCYEALNKGCRLATGDVIGWLHSDDTFYDQHVIEDVVDVFERTGCDVVYGNGLFVSETNHAWVLRDWQSGKYSSYSMANGWLPLHTTVFVRREIFRRYGFYREDYVISADSEWLLRILYKTNLNVQYMNRYVVIMAYGGLSTSWSKTFLRWREDLGIYYQHDISPRTALVKKVLSKVPQFLKAPFVKLPFTHLRHSFGQKKKAHAPKEEVLDPEIQKMIMHDSNATEFVPRQSQHAEF